MAGLVPAIHVFLVAWLKFVDARHKAGHDESGVKGLVAEPLRKLLEERHAGIELLHRNVLIGRMG